MTRPDALLFDAWMRRSFDQWVGPISPERRAEYDSTVTAVAAAMTSRGDRFWCEIPRAIQKTFGPRGFAWNGIYRVSARTLELVAAAGPPVCTALPLAGGPGSSGMCWDGVLMNQTLVAGDVKRWPGYVSCDGESGLRTVAGLVCPIRESGGRPIAVWDLDSTRPLAPEDPLFFDRLFATLSIAAEPVANDLEPH